MERLLLESPHKRARGLLLKIDFISEASGENGQEDGH